MRYLALILALAFAAPAIAEPHYPPLQGKPVVDAANIIPDDVEANMDNQLFAYEHQTGHQLMVATVPSLEGEDDESYATGYFKAVKLGGKDKDDGILFLIAPKEHKLRIITGFGTGGLLTDAQSGLILHDDVRPLFKQGEYVTGIQAGINDIIKATTPLTPAELALQQREKQRQQERSDRFWAGVQDFFLTLLAVAGVGGTGFGLYRLATAPERRRRKAEQERLAAEEAAREAEAEAERERQEAEAERKAQQEREQKLARMSPEQRTAFLAREEQQRQEEAERAYAASLAAQAEAERRRKQQAEEDASSSYSSSSYSSSDDDSSSSYSSSSDDSFSGGGGDTGGGGAGDSW